MSNVLRIFVRVLFPGGGADLPDSGYFKTAKIIYDLALKVRPPINIVPLYD